MIISNETTKYKIQMQMPWLNFSTEDKQCTNTHKSVVIDQLASYCWWNSTLLILDKFTLVVDGEGCLYTEKLYVTTEMAIQE